MDRGLGLDEIDTVFYAVEASSVWETLSSSVSFNNHIGYSVIARFSQALLGRSEWVFRLPALLFGLAGIFIFWTFSRALLTPRLAMISTLILALSPVHLLWSVTGRGYSGMILFTLLSSYFYLRLLQNRSNRDIIFFIVVSVLGTYIHLYSAFVIMVQFVYLLSLYVMQRLGKQTGRLVSAAAFRVVLFSHVIIGLLAVLMYAPALRSLLHDLTVRGRSDFRLAFPWKVIESLSGSEGAPLAVVVMVVSVCGLYSLPKSHPLEARYFALLLLGPLLIMWLARPFDLYPRLFSYWLPYYLMFIVAGLRALWYSTVNYRLKQVRYLSPLLVSLTASTVLLSWLTSWGNLIPEEGFRDASRALVADADKSAAFCALGGEAEVFQYYFDKRLVVPESMDDFSKLSGSHSEVRCLYFQASWETPEHTEVAQFLKEHGSWSKVKEVTLFVYRE